MALVESEEHLRLCTLFSDALPFGVCIFILSSIRKQIMGEEIVLNLFRERYHREEVLC